MAYNVSQSKVNTYRRCGEAYRFKYVLKLYRKKKKRPLVFGGLIHDMLEAIAEGDPHSDVLDNLDVKNQKLFAAEREAYGDILYDAEHIMDNYVDFWPKNSLRPIRRKGRSAEHHFNIEIAPGVFWNGKMDQMSKTPNKLKWMTEHKTFTRMPGEDDRWRNIQYVTYLEAADILGWPKLDGIAWNYIRSKPPAVPGILKDQTLSTKKIDSLPTVIEDYVEEAELDIKNYKSLIAHTKANRANYFKRIFMPVNSHVVEYLFTEFVETAIHMSNEHENIKGMNIGRHCGWCDYEPLCRARLTGADEKYLMKREYTNASSKPSKEGIYIHEGSIIDKA